jgi:2-methylaconitate cis-trans-isomerase PrpF
MTDGEAETDGDLAIDGIAGTAATVRLEFNDPGGAKTGRLLPTSRARDRLDVPGIGSIEATMVDAANPCVFVDAAALGKTGTESPDMSILVRMISIGQPHRAVPITGATCLAIATRIEGSLPNALAADRDGPIVIAHPSGVVMVDARVDHAHDAAKAHAVFGAVYRTMRKLFEGYVYYRPRQARSEAKLAAAVAAE